MIVSHNTVKSLESNDLLLLVRYIRRLAIDLDALTALYRAQGKYAHQPAGGAYDATRPNIPAGLPLVFLLY